MALNEQMQQMIQQDIQDAENRPKEEILKEQMEGLKTVGRTARDIALESIPGVSESLAEKRIDEAMQRGDTTGAMIEGAAGLMGAVPMVGDAAAKGLRSVTKAFRKRDIGEAEKLVDDAEKLQEWRDGNRLPESQRQKNIPEAQQAAEDLFQGNIKSKEARKRIKEVFPEPKLYTAETMPEMPTITDVVGSMGKKAEKGILGVKGFDLEPGQRVGARLDIPAYNEYDKWVVSIHDGKIRNGSVVGYGQAIRLKNIEFGSDPEVALDIAKGKRVAKKSGEEKPMGKATIARVFGDYVSEDPYELQEFAKKVLADKDSEWTQVGMNPYRGSYFYNKETGNVVTRADEVIQVGPLVLAKNVTEPKLSELKELFSQKTARTKDGKIRIFNEGGVVPMKRMAKQMELFEPVKRGFDEGGLMDEGGMVDEESGNEVPPGSLREEVRDDIPAQLSEGEFVFPADVVRYFGLEKLMEMRQEAKAGLARMEAMGQMGNSDEATLPDDIPFDVEDLEVDEEEENLEFQVGGYVPGMYQRPMTQPQPYSPYGQQPPSVFGPQPSYVNPSFTYTPDRSNLPTFQQTIGPGVPYVDFEYVEYVNDAGQTVRLRRSKTTGKLLDPVPAGFRPKSQKVTTQTTQVTTPRQDEGGGDRDIGVTSTTAPVPDFLKGILGTKEKPAGSTMDAFFDVSKTDIYGGTPFASSNKDLRSAIFSQGQYQLGTLGIGGIGTALAKEAGVMKYSFNDVAIAGNRARKDALDFLGFGDIKQLADDTQASLVAKAMKTAHEAAKKGQDVQAQLDQIYQSQEAKDARLKAAEQLKNQIVGVDGTYADAAETYSTLKTTYEDQLKNLLDGGFDNELGGKGIVTDSSGKAVQSGDGPVLTGAGKALKDQLEAKIGRTKAATALEATVGYENASGETLTRNDTRGLGDASTDVVKSVAAGADIEAAAFESGFPTDDSIDDETDAQDPGFGVDDGPTVGVGEDGPDRADTRDGSTVGVGEDGPDRDSPTVGVGEDGPDRGTTSGSVGRGEDSPSAARDAAAAAARADALDKEDADDGNDDSGGCFITTAVVEKKGEADDGETLTKLRKFRDEYMADKQEEVQEYYDIAPKIIKAIDNDEEWNWIENQIQKAIECIDEEKQDDAYAVYKNMVSTLKEKWLV